MNPDDRVRLRHIVDGLASAIRFSTGRRREDLDKNEMLTFALVHAIQIVGEAATKVGVDFRDQHPEIPWASIVGMRNRSASRRGQNRCTGIERIPTHGAGAADVELEDHQGYEAIATTGRLNYREVVGASIAGVFVAPHRGRGAFRGGQTSA
jgi:hypothetical protein